MGWIALMGLIGWIGFMGLIFFIPVGFFLSSHTMLQSPAARGNGCL